ncbi:MAG: ATP-binding cassette domain-containing protein [Slackia sp.]|nr:ATP-binding cassette domain-containing protein [Slackia sp.]
MSALRKDDELRADCAAASACDASRVSENAELSGMTQASETSRSLDGVHATDACAASEPHHEIHRDGHAHHRHTHACDSHHAGGHHLLQVEDLSVSFSMYDDAPGSGFLSWISAPQHTVEVIHGLNIGVHAGEIVAIVGASGSGKTLLADAILGISPENALVTGRIWFDGVEQDAQGLANLRGSDIAFVPQSVESLDPLMKVGRQVELFARGASPDQARARRKAVFARYGLDDAAAELYPFELSGGMARRVLLACALVNEPRLIIADEPTPGLDLELAVRAMGDFRAFADAGGGVLLITHDIELVLRVADRIAVFEGGTVVEETAVANFASPELLRHPFSRALWAALPEHGFAGGEVCEQEGAGDA